MLQSSCIKEQCNEHCCVIYQALQGNYEELAEEEEEERQNNDLPEPGMLYRYVVSICCFVCCIDVVQCVL